MASDGGGAEVRTTCTKRSSKSTMPPSMMTAPWWGSMAGGMVVGHGRGAAQLGSRATARVLLIQTAGY